MLSPPLKPTQSPFFYGKFPINAVSIAPVVKGDDGAVSSFKRPEVKEEEEREIPYWLGVQAKESVGRDLSVL